MLNLYTLNETYTNGFNYNILDIIYVTSILSGIFVIITKNPIVSILFLIALFINVASYLMVLGINFIGLSYLLVYVGAVSILFLFILMLINVRISELATNNNNSILLAAIVGILLFLPIYTKGSVSNTSYFKLSQYMESVDYTGYATGKKVDMYADILKQVETKINTFNDVSMSLNNIYNSQTQNIYFATSRIWDGALEDLSHITSIGAVIYTNYPIWLLLTSIILLLAMVGAIIITIKK